MPGRPIPEAEKSRWTWLVARVSGIPVRVHFTLLLLLLWFGWLEFQAAGPGSGASRSIAERGLVVSIIGHILFVTGLIACVLLHEIGHALIAKANGVRTSEIVLYPFGGVARLQGMGTPRQELWISLAGPAVSVLIGALLFGGLRLSGSWIPLRQLAQGDVNLLERLMVANVVLAAFNLIPAFPMDGGRVLRSLLAQRWGMVRGTVIAASVGQALAILFGLLGLIGGNFILVFIAFFVFVGASQEILVQRSIALMRGQPVSAAMITRFEVLSHDDSLGQAADLLLSSHQQDFPVVSGSEVMGVLTRVELVRGLTQRGPRANVADSARTDFVRLSPQEGLRDAVERMQSSSTRVGLVFADDRLVGMLTSENVGEFFRLQAVETSARQRND